MKKRGRKSRGRNSRLAIWRKGPRWRRVAWIVAGLVGVGVVIGAWVVYLVHDLPDEAALKAYKPQLTKGVRDREGKLLFVLPRPKNRLWRPLKQISPHLIRAVVTAEDDTFLSHNGLRIEEIRKALWQNVEAGRYVRGASTITQQLAKNAFLSHEKTLTRKIREAFLARRIERVLSKTRILELYLNVVEWGEDLHGAETAAQYYFGKSAGALSLPEAAALAAMLPNPKRFNPFKRRSAVERKQRRVLDLMRHNGIITAKEHQAALSSELRLSPGHIRARFKKRKGRLSCAEELLVRYLQHRVDPTLLRAGTAKICLTLQRDRQRELDDRVAQGTSALVLTMREEGAVRAVACIGETPWADADKLPKSLGCHERDPESQPDAKRPATAELGPETEAEGDSEAAPEALPAQEAHQKPRPRSCPYEKLTPEAFFAQELLATPCQ